MAPALSFVEVTKAFPGVLANDRVTLEIEQETIHGIIGENGAGKSTLMGLVSGLHQPDEGVINVFGQPRRITSPTVAAALGIGMVHQEFKLVPSMTVAENVVLGTRAGRGRLRPRVLNRAIGDLAERYRLALSPRAHVGDLPVGLRQRVEILKALHSGAKILIFDEPTAVLTPQEVDELFVTLRSLRDQGRTVVFISHKLREIAALTQRVCVMRHGRLVAEFATAKTTAEQLAELMVGRRVELHRGGERAAAQLEDTVALGGGVEHATRQAVAGSSALVAEHLDVNSDLGQLAIRDFSLEVRAGEIVGIAGVAGNGQLELEEGLAGLRRPKAGRLLLHDIDITHSPVRERRELGLAYIPESRLTTGAERNSSVAENMIMGGHYRAPVASRGQLRPRAIREHVDSLLKQFDVAADSGETRLGSLSGGNIQKVVIARELASTPSLLGYATPRVLIASQPTRGVDVGAIEYIHSQLLRLRAAGTAILLISFELDEIFFLADRIHVLFDGVLSPALDPATVDEREVGLLMGGEGVAAPVPGSHVGEP